MSRPRVSRTGEVNEKFHLHQRMRQVLKAVIAACPGEGTLSCCSIMEVLEMQASASGDGADNEKKRSQPE